ncbi:MAG: hypothetical protein KF852_07070 [Saprospiraceae bacterium]|nr:hypothetical protein [Saprospiraceae bacterium]
MAPDMQDIIPLHADYSDWTGQLDFFQYEIKVFETELAHVLNQHADQLSIIEHVDEYRRILNRKLEHIEGFRRQIALHEKQLADDPLIDNQESIKEHEALRVQIQQFHTDFENMKSSFRRFISRND